MIDFTIKTLDAKDHRFSVDDDITVQQLKEKVLEQMGVEIGLQRLIFCGRVLQDDKKLAEYAVHGKVVHMVQRLPPSLEAQQSTLQGRERDRERENTFTNHSATFTSEPINFSPVHLNHITQQQIRRLMSMAATAHGIEIEEQAGPNLSPAAARLEFVRRIILEMRASLDALIICESDIERGVGAPRTGRPRRVRPHATPHDLGRIVEELHYLEAEFAPFRQSYMNILRETGNAQVNIPERLVARRQVSADLCSELYHSFAHAYHAISDIGLLVAQNNTRLTFEASMRHHVPVTHAHINVVHATPARRSQSATATSAGTSSTAGQEEQTNAGLAGRENRQPTVNINIQSDPVTYQVEIETAVNIGNVFMNGNTSQGEHDQRRPDQRQPQQSQNDASQPNQDGLNDRRQVMIEFENLFRGLGQAGSIGGVEVVMSMEEIPHIIGAANINNAGLTNASQPAEGGVYIAQTADLLHNIVASVLRQGLVPGMEGFGVVHAVQHVQGQNQSQGQGEGQSQARNQGQGQPQPQPQTQTQPQPQPQPQPQTQPQPQPQTQSQAENLPQAQSQAENPPQAQSQAGNPPQAQPQAENPPQAQPQAENPPQTQSEAENPPQAQSQAENPPQAQSQAENPPQAQTQSQAQNQTPTQDRSQENHTNTQQNANVNSANANRPRQYPRGRRPRILTQAVDIFDLVYDRFLPCDSLHARSQLQRRQIPSPEDPAPPLPDPSNTQIQNDVELLYEMFDTTVYNDQSMIIAATLTLREAVQFPNGHILQTDELHPLRRRLQVYTIQLLRGVYQAGSQERLADLIIERHSAFLNRIATITPIRGQIDVTASIRAVFVRFLDEVMFVLGLEDIEVFSRRFRNLFSRMFYELCGVIYYCSLEGVEGLKKIYRSFMIEIFQCLVAPVANLLRGVAMENLDAAILRVELDRIHYPQFIRRRDQPSGPPRMVASSLFETESTRSAEQPTEENPADTEETDDSDDTEDAEDFDDELDMKAFEKAEQTSESSSTTELAPQVEAMQVSPPPPAVEPKEKSVDETEESEHRESRTTSTGSGRVDTDDDNPYRERIQEDTPQHITGECSQVKLQASDDDDDDDDNDDDDDDDDDEDDDDGDDDGDGDGDDDDDDDDDLDWPGPSTANTTQFDSPESPENTQDRVGCVSAVNNHGRISTNILRNPGMGQSNEASVSDDVTRSPASPPLAPPNLEDAQPMRDNSARGRFRINRYSKSGPAPYPPDSSDDSVLVPPAQIAQHWGETWGPTITRDLQQQRSASADEPYSDAYLSGMPPKKRRCLRQSRPPTSLNAFITEGVNAVSGSPDRVQAELRATVREHVRALSRSRAAASPDYEPRRFSSTARFLGQSRKSARRSPENSNE